MSYIKMSTPKLGECTVKISKARQESSRSTTKSSMVKLDVTLSKEWPWMENDGKVYVLLVSRG